ncbi:DUF2149 domain-containing protein [Schlesneria paludicola]|uniref:DUF2149 domain-containing protein n=1 Tax=Schlesneria paludicola TaxID=360056 RepID=UPI00029A7303|nr:DUF2149 domain-containing protein [Schlesneria paludicola]
MRRRTRAGLGMLGGTRDDDPLANVANLFEAGILLALGFLVALISALNLLTMFDADSKVTITTEKSDGSLEIVVKEGRKTTIRRMTKQVGSGDGTRLGVAYRLADGTVIYVPESQE